EINESKPECVISQLKAAAFDVQQKTGRTPVIAPLGLAVKPNSDDLRESPASNITEALSDQFHGSKILTVAPQIDYLPERLQTRHRRAEGIPCFEYNRSTIRSVQRFKNPNCGATYR